MIARHATLEMHVKAGTLKAGSLTGAQAMLDGGG